jgi:formylglycine-generating enzyme required for sulfatase activity
VGTSGAVFAEDVDALSTAFDEVAERILNQANSLFILAYCSPKRAGVHDLALKLNGASVRIENTFDATGFEGGCEPEHFVSSAVEDPPTHPDPSDGFVLIPIGRFDMGCTPAQEPFGCSETELPVNLVTFTGAFYMGTTEVTQGEFGALMGYNPSYVLSCGSDCPVDNLTWHESAAYANALSVAEGLDACYGCAGSGSTVTCLPLSESDPYGCGGYRLPTEAEWEYAARAGTDLVYSGSDLVYEVAWTSLTSDGTPHPVGSLAANGWGLYDMSGNVSEWTGDLWGEETYAGGDRVDPVGAVESFYRMHRGGSHNSVYVRVAIRSFSIPAIRSSGLGFRLVRTSP